VTEQSKDKLLMELANFRAERRKERRQLEWRFTAALWAGLAGAIYKGFCFPLLPFVVVVLVHIWWVGLNWVRNERDIRKAFFYIDRLHVLTIDERPQTEPRIREIIARWFGRAASKSGEWPQIRGFELLGCLLDAMYWIEIVVTVGLATAAYVVGQQHCGGAIGD
jgi:hypothetical protein